MDPRSNPGPELPKGPERPIYPCPERVELLAALEIVDAIAMFDDATPERMLAAVKPDVHVMH